MSATKTVLGDEYPDYISACIPYFILFVGLEQILGLLIKKKDDFLLKDSFSSLSTGLTTIIYEKLVPSTILATIEFIGVIYIWRNWRIIDIPEDSKIASLACFLLVDFGYYWFHRMAHEINYIWATHATHHSSEKYNLSTALRQSVFQIYTSWIFYLPLGFFMPPQLYFYHKQLNTIYQFWIHTKYIGKLGPIDWIFNTPTHHRVHHGRNPKYLDKNYAGTLIVWDRMFGTFQEEDEEVFYGLVHPLGSSDPSWCQIHHWVEMAQATRQHSSILDKIKVFFYGPGWIKGGPRLGSIDDIPVPHNGDIPERLGTPISTMLSVYISVHFLTVSLASLASLAMYETALGHTWITMIMVYLYLSLTSFGAIFDHKKYALHFELCRLLVFISITWQTSNAPVQYMRILYLVSALFIAVNYVKLPKHLKTA
eukprot:gene10929-12736_t